MSSIDSQRPLEPPLTDAYASTKSLLVQEQPKIEIERFACYNELMSFNGPQRITLTLPREQQYRYVRPST